MAGSHNENQILVGCWCNRAFVDKIDEARGTQQRSQFVRDALRKMLCDDFGISVPLSDIAPPDRSGKGGPSKRFPKHIKRYSASVSSSFGLCEDSKVLKATVEGEGSPPAKSPRSPGVEAPSAQISGLSVFSSPGSKPPPVPPKPVPRKRANKAASK